MSDLNLRSPLAWLLGALLLTWCVGMFARGYWTPDEPREADIAWRMSWQADKAVPLLAGEAFCEKPPLTYWLAAVPIELLGMQAWIARLPNLLYALITALGVGLLASRSAGRFAGLVGAAAISTFLLSYQVAIWLATDAPLLASCFGRTARRLHRLLCPGQEGAPARLSLDACRLGIRISVQERGRLDGAGPGYLTLSVWEKRWRELLRWELYAGLLLQAAIILTWVWFVYRGADGAQHLKVFFWNNLVGRFAAVDAPPDLQYAAAHRNSPGKYLIELPMYLFPWTLLAMAAARRAWRQRQASRHDNRAVRFAIAASVPALVVLSLAATARNVYFAPALPGIALLISGWGREILTGPDLWDVRALRASGGAAAARRCRICRGVDADWRRFLETASSRRVFIVISGLGCSPPPFVPLRAWTAARDRRRSFHGHCSSPIARCSSDPPHRCTGKWTAGRTWRRSAGPSSTTPLADR